MGLLDSVVCMLDLPGWADKDTIFQTKSLGCQMTTYHIDKSGRLLQCEPVFGPMTKEEMEEETRKYEEFKEKNSLFPRILSFEKKIGERFIDQHFEGDFDFYTWSNELDDMITFTVSFKNGIIKTITNKNLNWTVYAKISKRESILYSFRVIIQEVRNIVNTLKY